MRLASELQTTAASYASTIGELTTSWQGPSSTAAASAAAPYTAWLSNTAAQAEQTASQAQAAAAAYEAAFAASIPPPLIEANRALLAALVATNFLGQNTPAIAATEATYAEFWAQDAGAMYGYAGAATTASQLTPFTAAPATTNDSGQATQSAATAQSAASSSADSLSAFLTQLNTELTHFGTEVSTLSSTLDGYFPATSTTLAQLVASLGLPPSVTNAITLFNQALTTGANTLSTYAAGPWIPVGIWQPAEELVAGLHLYPEPRYGNPGHRPAAPPDAHYGGAVAAVAQRAAERLVRRRWKCRSIGVRRPGRHHRFALGAAELGVGGPGGPDGRGRDERNRARRRSRDGVDRLTPGCSARRPCPAWPVGRSAAPPPARRWGRATAFPARWRPTRSPPPPPSSSSRRARNKEG